MSERGPLNNWDSWGYQVPNGPLLDNEAAALARFNLPAVDATEPIYHYFEDCGAPESDDDVYASEPWGITCPFCEALL